MKTEHFSMLTEGRFAEVIPLLEAESNATPSDRQATEDLALGYSQCRRFTDAVRLYEDILHRFPDDPMILVNAGHCYFQLGQHQQAFVAYTKVIDQADAVAVDPQVLSLAWTNLAALYEHYTYYEEAYSRYRMAIQVYPDNQLAKKYLEQLENLADPDNGSIGIRRLPNGAEVPALWDGSFASNNRSRRIERK